MSVISKTVLCGMGFFRRGSPFSDISSKPTVNSINLDFSNRSLPFYGIGTEESISSVYIPSYFLRGFPFLNETAKSSIDASGFEFTRQGQSFWVPFSGSIPPSYTSSQFFIMF